MTEENKEVKEPSEAELYYMQMESWFKEHEKVEGQIIRTIKYNGELADINKEQLVLHRKRTALATADFNKWAQENNLPPYTPGLLYD